MLSGSLGLFVPGLCTAQDPNPSEEGAPVTAEDEDTADAAVADEEPSADEEEGQHEASGRGEEEANQAPPEASSAAQPGESENGEGQDDEEGPDDSVPADLQPPSLSQPITVRYPPMAMRRRRRPRAKVVLTILVDSRGRVERALVSHSAGLDLGFDAAAREAAKNFVFSPATRNGSPVRAWTRVEIQFAPP